MLAAVTAATTISDKSAAFAAERFTPFASPAPNFCDVRTVKPVVSPIAKPVTRNMIVPVEPTAASAFCPTKRPTMIVSTML